MQFLRQSKHREVTLNHMDMSLKFSIYKSKLICYVQGDSKIDNLKNSFWVHMIYLLFPELLPEYEPFTEVSQVKITLFILGYLTCFWICALFCIIDIMTYENLSFHYLWYESINELDSQCPHTIIRIHYPLEEP